ncbi:MAG: BadF/BadG/BcrA/BcrD ATPase family protein [Lentisphaeria bacterium]|jgi:glucosamine kinase
MTMNTSLIIGVDGGGTHSKLVAVLADGTVLGVGNGEGLNYNAIGMASARARLKHAVDKLLEKIGRADYDGLSLGLSALDARADSATAAGFAGDIFPPGKLLLDSDACAALIGALLGKPGVIVISGTGAMILGLDENMKEHVIGGWGYKLDEPGGGYGLAIAGLKAALMNLEQIGPDTELARCALDFFSVDDARGLINALYEEGCEPAAIAKFARVVDQQAEAGDSVSMELATEQMAILAKMTGKILERCPQRLCLYGGMFEHSGQMRRLFLQELSSLCADVELHEMELPPELGAVLMYMMEHGTLNDEIVTRMKHTWEHRAR